MQNELQHLGHWKRKRDPPSYETTGWEKIILRKLPAIKEGENERCSIWQRGCRWAEVGEDAMTEFRDVESL